MDDITTVITKDGSTTLFAPQFNEIYHSRNGAVAEANYVYIQKGLADFVAENPAATTLHIFEVGYGTGLNAWLSAIFAIENKITIHYSGIEQYPLSANTFSLLNFSSYYPSYSPLLTAIQQAEWDVAAHIHPCFFCKKIKADLHHYPATGEYDIIFFDAFAPSHQPELWEPIIFQKILAMMKKNSRLTTYCAKGTVKRALESVGFCVEKLPGPPGKREMIRARKTT